MASSTPRFWREAATLILAARSPRSINQVRQVDSSAFIKVNFDYQVLMLKRSGMSRFLPSAHVFPGGVSAEADFSEKWNDVFTAVSGRSLKDVAQELNPVALRPPCMAMRRNDVMPNDIAFRICAIRETFEESGILLAKTRGGLEDQKGRASVVDFKSAAKWQSEIDKDPGNFIKLCQEHQLVPDVWSLTEWCNWLTPAFKKVDTPPPKPKRYDTMFYVCCLDGNQLPHAEPDNRETYEPEWYSPPEYLHLSTSEMKILGPTFLELGRLCNFPTLEDVRRFSLARTTHGCGRWMAVYCYCHDGTVSLLPGDKLYPDDPDYEGTIGVWPKTVSESCEELTNGIPSFEATDSSEWVDIPGVNRTVAKDVVRDTTEWRYYFSTPGFGHLKPRVYGRTVRLGAL